MSFKCAITGKRPSAGHSRKYRGIAIKKGGIGLKLTGKTNRVFRPNLQRVKVRLPSGQVKHLLVSTKALKSGAVQKA